MSMCRKLGRETMSQRRPRCQVKSKPAGSSTREDRSPAGRTPASGVTKRGPRSALPADGSCGYGRSAAASAASAVSAGRAGARRRLPPRRPACAVALAVVRADELQDGAGAGIAQPRLGQPQDAGVAAGPIGEPRGDLARRGSARPACCPAAAGPGAGRRPPGRSPGSTRATGRCAARPARPRCAARLGLESVGGFLVRAGRGRRWSRTARPAAGLPWPSGWW